MYKIAFENENGDIVFLNNVKLITTTNLEDAISVSRETAVAVADYAECSTPLEVLFLIEEGCYETHC